MESEANILTTIDGMVKISIQAVSGVRVIPWEDVRGFDHGGSILPETVTRGYFVQVSVYGEWYSVKYFSAEPEMNNYTDYRPSDKQLGEAKSKAIEWVSKEIYGGER